MLVRDYMDRNDKSTGVGLNFRRDLLELEDILLDLLGQVYVTVELQDSRWWVLLRMVSFWWPPLGLSRTATVMWTRWIIVEN